MTLWPWFFFCSRAPEVRSHKPNLEHSYKPSYWHTEFPILLFEPTNAWPQTQVSLGLGFCPFLEEEVQGGRKGKNTTRFIIWGFGCFFYFFKHCQRQWVLHGLKECEDKKGSASQGRGWDKNAHLPAVQGHKCALLPASVRSVLPRLAPQQGVQPKKSNTCMFKCKEGGFRFNFRKKFSETLA